MDKEKIWISFLILLIVSPILFEVGLLLYAYLNADRVSCNLLWCEFTQERTKIEDRTIISSFKECYENGVKINCTE